MVNEEAVNKLKEDYASGRINKTQAKAQLKGIYRGNYSLEYKQIRNSLGFNPADKRRAIQTGENIPDELKGYVSKVQAGKTEIEITPKQSVENIQKPDLRVSEIPQNTEINYTPYYENRSSSMLQTAEQKTRIGSGETYTYYDNGIIERSNINPTAELIRQGGKVKTTTGEGNRPQISSIIYPESATPIYEKSFTPADRSEANNIIGYQLGPANTTVRGITSTYKADTTNRNNYTIKADKQKTDAILNYESKPFKSYFQSASGESVLYLGDNARLFKETVKKPSVWAVAVGVTAITTKNPALATKVAYLGTAIGGFYAYSNLKQIGEGKKRLGEVTGELAGYYVVGATTKYAFKTYSHLKAEYQFKFKSPDRKSYLDYEYYNLEGQGQRDLYGKNIKTPKPVGNKNKIGFGIEKNTLKQPDNLYQSTGQNKLINDKLVAVDSFGNINKVTVDANKNVFVYNSQANNFIEYDASKYKILTINPKYNILSNKPTVSFFEPSTQTTLTPPKPIKYSNLPIFSNKPLPTTTSQSSNIKIFSNPNTNAVNKLTVKNVDTSFNLPSLKSEYSSLSYTPDAVATQPITTKANGFKFNNIIIPTFNFKPTTETQTNSKINNIKINKFNFSNDTKSLTSTKIKQIPNQKIDLNIKQTQNIGSIQLPKVKSDTMQQQGQIQEYKQITKQEAKLITPITTTTAKTTTKPFYQQQDLNLNIKLPSGFKGVKTNPFKTIKPQKQPTTYNPSIYSIFGNVKASKVNKGGVASGLGIRPVIKERKKLKLRGFLAL